MCLIFFIELLPSSFPNIIWKCFSELSVFAFISDLFYSNLFIYNKKEDTMENNKTTLNSGVYMG